MLFRSSMMSGKTSFSTLFEEYVLQNHKDFVPIRLTCTSFKANGCEFASFWKDLMGYEFRQIIKRTSHINEDLEKVILIIDEAQILYGYPNDSIWSTIKDIQLKMNHNLFIMLFGIHGNNFYKSSSNKSSPNSNENYIEITPDDVDIRDCYSLKFFLYDEEEFEFFINNLCEQLKITPNNELKLYFKNRIGCHAGILKIASIFLLKFFHSTENSFNEIKRLLDSLDFEKDVKRARCCYYFEKVMEKITYKTLITQFLKGDKDLNLTENHYLIKVGVFTKELENSIAIYNFPSPIYHNIFQNMINHF